MGEKRARNAYVGGENNNEDAALKRELAREAQVRRLRQAGWRGREGRRAGPGAKGR